MLGMFIISVIGLLVLGGDVPGDSHAARLFGYMLAILVILGVAGVVIGVIGIIIAPSEFLQ